MQNDYNQPGGGGGAPSPSSSAASAASSAIQFGNLVSADGGLTPLAGVILGVIGLLAFIALVVVAKK